MTQRSTWRRWRLGFAAALAAWARGAVAQTDVSPELESIREKHHLPGMLAMVVKDGRIGAVGSAGVARQGESRRIRLEDRINIASCTKWMTATVAARLVERGVLSWKMRIREAFPDWATFNAAYPDETITEFLAHRSGMEDNDQWSALHDKELAAQTGSAVEVRRWVARKALADPPQVKPGSYLYSNQGYSVAAVMLEAAAGKPWETLMEEEIFKPLEMASARLGITYGTGDAAAETFGHQSEGGGAVARPLAAPTETELRQYQAEVGAGGFVAVTMRDWAKFLQAQMVEGANYLGDQARRKLRTPYTGEEGYALGVGAYNREWARPGQALTHSGRIFGEECVFWMSPGKKFAALAFTNASGVDSTAAAALDEAASMLVSRFAKAEAVDGPLLK